MASTLNTPTIPRSATWIGGIALLLIAVLAGIGNFGSLTPLITAGDAATTAQAIAGAEQQFRVGVCSSCSPRQRSTSSSLQPCSSY